MKVDISYPKIGKETVKIKTEYSDLWNMPQTFAYIILPILKKYRALYNKKNSHVGYPMIFIDDWKKIECMTEEQEKELIKRWTDILDKMIYSFTAVLSNHGWDGPLFQVMLAEVDATLKPHKKRLKQLQKQEHDKENYESDEWSLRMELSAPVYEKYHPLLEEHAKKVDEGLMLFAQYYKHLCL